MKSVCSICPHQCDLSPGQIGFCRARQNIDGVIQSINYGKITSIALDPIEKKPLDCFFPGSRILSVGSFGCNLRCPFCQNHEISMADAQSSSSTYYSPEKLVETAVHTRSEGNIGIAFTYNEPLIGYEYVTDTSRLAKKFGLETVLVTNGYINEAPLLELLPGISALNIDLKSFSKSFYSRISGDLETVKRSIEIAALSSHVEVTTLIIPGENDSEDEMRALSLWLAGVDPEIPYHITRFYPMYKMTDRTCTSEDVIERLADIASESLKRVFV
jgi:pyruvate formate lyase activating enzyme